MSFFSKRLRKASFKGVSFEVESSGLTFGRRTVTHEYPQRDKPYVEDLGKATRTFTLQGFVIGDDYIAHAKRLIKVFEENGPGILVHPWLGKLTVHAIDTPSVTWDLSLGYARFTMTFLEPGELENPGIAQSWGSELRQLADDIYTAACENFGINFDIDNALGLVNDIAEGSYQDILGCLGDSKFARVFELGDAVSDLIDTAVSDLEKPADQIADEILSALGIANAASSIRNWRDSVASITDVLKDNVFTRQTAQLTAAATDDFPAPATVQETAESSLETLTRQIMIGNMLGAVTLIGTTQDTDSADETEETVTTAKDVDKIIEIRNQSLSILEREMMLLGTDDDALYPTLQAAYSAVYRDLTERALEFNASVEFTPPTVMPALVLAYDRYEDANREPAIVKRNGITHPLFMPVKALRLSKN